jgi:hypothetical protein
MGEVDHVFPSTKNMKQSSDMEKRKPKGKCQKIELYREPQTNGTKGIKTLYTSIDSTLLKDIFDLVGHGQYCYVGSMCKAWNAVYWQGDNHDQKMEMFWHNQQ